MLVPEYPDPSVITDDSLTDALSDSNEEDGDDPTVMPCRGSHPNLEERKDDDEEEDGQNQVEGDNSCSEKEEQESSSGEDGEKRAFPALFAPNKETLISDTGQKLPLTELTP
jgi:hypothetical protein